MKYTATHTIYEHGEAVYLWDNEAFAVLKMDGSHYCYMGPDWASRVLRGDSKRYCLEPFIVNLENE